MSETSMSTAGSNGSPHFPADQLPSWYTPDAADSRLWMIGRAIQARAERLTREQMQEPAPPAENGHSNGHTPPLPSRHILESSPLKRLLDEAGRTVAEAHVASLALLADTEGAPTFAAAKEQWQKSPPAPDESDGASGGPIRVHVLQLRDTAVGLDEHDGAPSSSVPQATAEEEQEMTGAVEAIGNVGWETAGPNERAEFLGMILAGLRRL